MSPPLDPLLLLTVAALQRSVSPATAVEELLCRAGAAEVDHESGNKKRKMRLAVFPTHNDKAGWQSTVLHGGAVTALVHPDSRPAQLGRRQRCWAEGGGQQADADGPPGRHGGGADGPGERPHPHDGRGRSQQRHAGTATCRPRPRRVTSARQVRVPPSPR